jgi:hypothetical protein
MSKTDIDYSNTIIYKIYCKDESIKDLYVGHTTNFVQRKHAHKMSCTREKYYNYNCKVYKLIRENGGWDNWSMEIVNFFNCKNQKEARIKEQDYFISLNATLNSVEPFPERKKYIKKTNNIELEQKKNIEQINEKFTEKNKFFCGICVYSTDRKSSFNKHKLSGKHINNTKLKSEEENLYKFFCKNCNKSYNARNSLWYHSQKCTHISANNNTNALLKETNDQVDLLTNSVIELQKQISYLSIKT